MKIVNRKLLAAFAEEAAQSPRRRKNFNLHPGDTSACHRLLNAVEPDSYIRPHRHLDPEKDEAFIIMNGRLGVILFSESGQVLDKVLLSAATGNLAVDIPHGVYHTAVSLEPGTVFFEAKAGPYLPLTEAETAAWAPLDNSCGAEAYLESLKMLFEG